jgi:hypothetical protein
LFLREGRIVSAGDKSALNGKMIPCAGRIFSGRNKVDFLRESLHRMKFFFRYAIPFLFPALGIFSCTFLFPAGADAGTGREIRVETSESKAPKWAGKVPGADEEYLYFVGRATGSLTLEGGEQDAAADALRQVVAMIGLTASLSYERLRREAELLLEDRVSFEGDARVVGLKRLETYYEKILYHTGDSLTTRYNVSLLVRYPRQSLNQEKARLEKEALSRVSMARELLSGGEKYESENDGAEALDRYLQGLRHLDGQVLFFLPVSRYAGFERLKQSLLASARRLCIEQGLVQIEPVVLSRSDDEQSWQDSQMSAALAEVMLNQGFKPAGRPGNYPQGILPRLSSRCTEEQVDKLGDDFFISRWSVAFGLLHPDENTILVQKVLTAKGFGADPERAGMDARRKLKNEVFPEFAVYARDKMY